MVGGVIKMVIYNTIANSLSNLALLAFITIFVVVIQVMQDGLGNNSFWDKICINFHLNNGFSLWGIYISNKRIEISTISFVVLGFYLLEIFAEKNKDVKEAKVIKAARVAILLIGIGGQFAATYLSSVSIFQEVGECLRTILLAL
jgi:hypothetical protein